MTEMVLKANTLPPPLFQLIQTEKIKVRQLHGEIRLIPIQEHASANDCPLLGLYSSGKLTVDKHLAWNRENKALEEK